MHQRHYKAVAILAFVLAWIGSSSSAESKSDAFCASVLTSAFPADTHFDRALGFFKRRAEGLANGPVFADYLDEHFDAVPYVEAASACLRGSSVRRDRERAVEFWKLAGILPRVDEYPPVVVALSQDGFPIHLVRLQPFATLPAYDQPWITDVALIHDEDEAALTPLFRAPRTPSPRFERLRTLHVATTHGSDLPFRLVPDSIVAPLLGQTPQLLELCIGSGMLTREVADNVPDSLEALRVVPLAPEHPLDPEAAWFASRNRLERERLSVLRPLLGRLHRLRALDVQNLHVRLSDLRSCSRQLQTLTIGCHGEAFNERAARTLFRRLSSLEEVNLIGWTRPLPPADFRLEATGEQSIRKGPYEID